MQVSVERPNFEDRGLKNKLFLSSFFLPETEIIKKQGGTEETQQTLNLYIDSLDIVYNPDRTSSEQERRNAEDFLITRNILASHPNITGLARVCSSVLGVDFTSCFKDGRVNVARLKNTRVKFDQVNDRFPLVKLALTADPKLALRKNISTTNAQQLQKLPAGFLLDNTLNADGFLTMPDLTFYVIASENLEFIHDFCQRADQQEVLRGVYNIHQRYTDVGFNLAHITAFMESPLLMDFCINSGVDYRSKTKPTAAFGSITPLQSLLHGRNTPCVREFLSSVKKKDGDAAVLELMQNVSNADLNNGEAALDLLSYFLEVVAPPLRASRDNQINEKVKLGLFLSHLLTCTEFDGFINLDTLEKLKPRISSTDWIDAASKKLVFDAFSSDPAIKDEAKAAIQEVIEGIKRSGNQSQTSTPARRQGSPKASEVSSSSTPANSVGTAAESTTSTSTPTPEKESSRPQNPTRTPKQGSGTKNTSALSPAKEAPARQTQSPSLLNRVANLFTSSNEQPKDESTLAQPHQANAGPEGRTDSASVVNPTSEPNTSGAPHQPLQASTGPEAQANSTQVVKAGSELNASGASHQPLQASTGPEAQNSTQVVKAGSELNASGASHQPLQASTGPEAPLNTTLVSNEATAPKGSNPVNAAAASQEPKHETPKAVKSVTPPRQAPQLSTSTLAHVVSEQASQNNSGVVSQHPSRASTTGHEISSATASAPKAALKTAPKAPVDPNSSVQDLSPAQPNLLVKRAPPKQPVAVNAQHQPGRASVLNQSVTDVSPAPKGAPKGQLNQSVADLSPLPNPTVLQRSTGAARSLRFGNEEQDLAAALAPVNASSQNSAQSAPNKNSRQLTDSKSLQWKLMLAAVALLDEKDQKKFADTDIKKDKYARLFTFVVKKDPARAQKLLHRLLQIAQENPRSIISTQIIYILAGDPHAFVNSLEAVPGAMLVSTQKTTLPHSSVLSINPLGDGSPVSQVQIKLPSTKKTKQFLAYVLSTVDGKVELIPKLTAEDLITDPAFLKASLTSVNTSDRRSVLHWAAISGSGNMLSLVLDGLKELGQNSSELSGSIPDVNTEDFWGNTTVHEAVFTGSYDVKSTQKYRKFFCDNQTYSHKVAVASDLANNSYELMKTLSSAGANFNGKRNKKEELAVQAAIKGNQYDLIATLLGTSNGFELLDLYSTSRARVEGVHLLHFAAALPEVTSETLTLLNIWFFKKNIQLLNKPDAAGFVPAHYAASSANVSALVTLKMLGADLNVKHSTGPDGQSPLSMALSLEPNTYDPKYQAMWVRMCPRIKGVQAIWGVEGIDSSNFARLVEVVELNNLTPILRQQRWQHQQALPLESPILNAEQCKQLSLATRNEADPEGYGRAITEYVLAPIPFLISCGLRPTQTDRSFIQSLLVDKKLNTCLFVLEFSTNGPERTLRKTALTDRIVFYRRPYLGNDDTNKTLDELTPDLSSAINGFIFLMKDSIAIGGDPWQKNSAGHYEKDSDGKRIPNSKARFSCNFWHPFRGYKTILPLAENAIIEVEEFNNNKGKSPTKADLLVIIQKTIDEWTADFLHNPDNKSADPRGESFLERLLTAKALTLKVSDDLQAAQTHKLNSEDQYRFLDDTGGRGSNDFPHAEGDDLDEELTEDGADKVAGFGGRFGGSEHN